MNILLSSFGKYGYMWLIVTVCLIAFITAIVRLGNFRKDQKQGAKQLDTYAQLLAKFNESTVEQYEISKKYGINSPELMEAKNRSMAIFGEMQKCGIQ